MATTTIPWGDGSGDNIYLTYSASQGDQTVLVSSDANCGAARQKVITFVSTVGNISRSLTVLQESGMDLVSITWDDVCITYNDTAIAYPYVEQYIVFVDSEVEQICATNWGDGTGIKPSQAAQVTTLNGVFKNNTDISSFDELKYFTGLTTLNQQFSGSTLTKVTLPEGVEITNSSNFKQIFYNCTYIEDVDLSDCTRTGTGVSTQTQMFNNCSALTKVHFQSVEQINDFARTIFSATDVPFGYNADTHYVYVNGEELRNLVIPSTITAINPGAFYRFNRLTSVIIPSSVTSIGASAFEECYGLTDVVVNGPADMGVFQHSGASLSVLTIKGNSGGKTNGYFAFATIKIEGNFTATSGSSHQFGRETRVGTYDFVLRIGGDASFNSSPQEIYDQDIVFFEVIGNITNTGGYLFNKAKDGCILHLGYNGKVTSPASYFMRSSVYSRYIDKVYVGDGSSASHDDAVLAQYLADNDWAAYSSKLDTWYNYINDPNANSDYIN